MSWTPSLLLFYAWHVLDGLTHLLLESTYVYGCFAYHVPLTAGHQKQQEQCSTRHFLGRSDRLYGNVYGSSALASIWQEVARADARYAGIDLTTLSLEIITVALAGPMAIYVAEKVRRDVQGQKRRKLSANTCFWAAVLASGELYGGLETDDFVYFWIYIVFSNMVWVALPVWVLRQIYFEMVRAFEAGQRIEALEITTERTEMEKKE
ncbi:MAG: hypothetical protein Q9167_006425 [Letrouitia subvulpina]